MERKESKELRLRTGSPIAGGGVVLVWNGITEAFGSIHAFTIIGTFNPVTDTHSLAQPDHTHPRSHERERVWRHIILPLVPNAKILQSNQIAELVIN